MNGVLAPLSPPPELQAVFRTYQCGLCHELEARFGFRYRLFATVDAVLLNVLLDAEAGRPAALTRRACPLAPVVSRNLPVRVATENTVLAAAWTVYLGVARLHDDVVDEGGLAKRLAWWSFRPGAVEAARILRAAGCDLDAVDAAFARQAALEAGPPRPLAEAAEPTATIAGVVFGPRIGAPLGAFLHALDNVLDFGEDRRARRYNALARPDDPPAVLPADRRAAAQARAWEATRALAVAVRSLPATSLRGFVENVLVRGFHDKLVRLEALSPEDLDRATLASVTPARAGWRALYARVAPRWAQEARHALAILLVGLFPRWGWAQGLAGASLPALLAPAQVADTAWDEFLDTCFCPRCCVVACENSCNDVSC